MKKASVDTSKCIGCGACVSIYPDNFDFNSEGLSNIISEENITEEMQDICPTGAIEVTEVNESNNNENNVDEVNIAA